jgi:tRNA threonylcarbamoyl adenosine modification protein YeaZ
MDTATPAVTAGVVELAIELGIELGVESDSAAPRLRSAVVAHDARKHAELLMPAVQQACREAGVVLRDLGAVVTGVGPGPFTGLRVGMVTAAALGDALGIGVHGVGSLDAIARQAAAAESAVGNLLVVTDARRREVYWAGYDPEARRLTGPHVEPPAVLETRAAELEAVAAAGDPRLAALSGLPVVDPPSPGSAALVACAAPDLRGGVVPGPLEPLYLRRPDAVVPGVRKRVSA